MKRFKNYIEDYRMSAVPNYRPEGTPEMGCNASCKWWRPGTEDNPETNHICERYGFNCDPEWVCDGGEKAVASVDAPGV